LLTLDLSLGQFVSFHERGRLNPRAARVDVVIRMRLRVYDADSGREVTGPESWFTVWVDNVVLRPGERWPWPPASAGGYVAGALEDAPLNRAFRFTGVRRVAFNGASEGMLTNRVLDAGPSALHWGLEAGTLEFWCRPHWDPEDGVERVFFDGMAYMHRRQSALRKLGAAGNNQLEFTIAGSDGKPHTVRGTAPLRKGEWHHIAATWSFPRAHLQLFVDGRLVAAEGPGPTPWAYSLTARGGLPGMGIEEGDSRSLPMQAYIGGDRSCRQAAAEADLDEFRISDVVRYQGGFQPLRRQCAVDATTRALFLFEN
jgi:hypothetical protein